MVALNFVCPILYKSSEGRTNAEVIKFDQDRFTCSTANNIKISQGRTSAEIIKFNQDRFTCSTANIIKISQGHTSAEIIKFYQDPGSYQC